MDQHKDEIREKKIYQKPLLTKVELIAEEAVLSVCKGGHKTGDCAIMYTCAAAPGS